MKFRTVFIIFNIVIVVSFLFIFFVPLLLLGGEYYSLFVSRNWIAALLFLLALAVVNGYFIRNWKLFSLLETEDWPALVRFLESQIYEKERLRASYVKTAVNAYLITSALDGIRRLERQVRERRPALARRFAVQFGIPYQLSDDPDASERYFGKVLSEKGVKGREWLRWNYAFTLMQHRQAEAAVKECSSLLERTREPMVTLLTLYLLAPYAAADTTVKGRVDAGKRQLRRRFTRAKWRRYADRARSSTQVLVLSRIIADAERWLFGSQTPASGAGGAN